MKSNRRSDWLSAWLFLLPNLLGFLVFVAFPVVFSILVAFTNWDLTLHNRFRHEPIKWVGLGNFRELLSRPDFWKYFGNTWYLMLGIPVGIAGALVLALLLSRPLTSTRSTGRWRLTVASVGSFVLLGLCLWAVGYGLTALVVCVLGGLVLALGMSSGATVYRTLFYLPSFTSGVAIYLLWKQMYNPLNGPIDHALQPLLDQLATLVNHTSATLWHGGGWALWAVAVVGVLWLGGRIVRGWRLRDFGSGMALLSLATIATLGLVLFGLGLVLMHLPNWTPDGLKAPDWLTDVHWAKPAIIIMGVWAAVGGNNMLLYIAGLSNIPPQLYEAADIDGAGRWQRFWNVTWPQLAPTTFFIVIMSVIGGLQGGFEQARAMTGGGPYGATTTLSYYIYDQGFSSASRLGYASAVAWFLFAMILVLTLVNYRFGSTYVND